MFLFSFQLYLIPILEYQFIYFPLKLSSFLIVKTTGSMAVTGSESPSEGILNHGDNLERSENGKQIGTDLLARLAGIPGILSTPTRTCK